jgi:hypothetical protein
MSSTSAAALKETPQARAQRLYKDYINNPVESYGGASQALDNLNGKIILGPYLKAIIKVHIKKDDLTLSFVESQIKPEDRDKVYTAIGDATLTLGGGKRKSRKSSKSRRRKSKTSKRKSRKN